MTISWLRNQNARDVHLVSWLENFLRETLLNSRPSLSAMARERCGLELPLNTLMFDILPSTHGHTSRRYLIAHARNYKNDNTLLDVPFCSDEVEGVLKFDKSAGHNYGSLFWTKIGHLDSQCIWYRTVLFWSAYLGFPSKMDRGSIIMDRVFWSDYFGSIIMDRVFWIDYDYFGVVARSQSLLRGGRLK